MRIEGKKKKFSFNLFFLFRPHTRIFLARLYICALTKPVILINEGTGKYNKLQKMQNNIYTPSSQLPGWKKTVVVDKQQSLSLIVGIFKFVIILLVSDQKTKIYFCFLKRFSHLTQWFIEHQHKKLYNKKVFFK